MTRLTFVTGLSIAVMLATPGLALAQGAAPPAGPAPQGEAAAAAGEAGGRQAMAACRGDLASLCANVEKGGGRKVQCLKDNQAKLSPGCQTAIQGVLEKRGAAGAAPAGGSTAAGSAAPEGAQAAGSEKAAKIKQSCASDAAALCAGIEKGGGRIMKCLKENEAKLSPACQSAVKERQGLNLLKKNVKQACATDRQALCGTAEKGRAAMVCLREKAASTSPGCQQALASLPAKGGPIQR